MSSPSQIMQDFQAGRIDRRLFIRRAMALGISLAGIEAMLQACGGGSGGSGSGTTIKWTNWANTGEIQRFKDFTADYNKKHNTNVQYTFVPSADNNYFSKLLTSLNGGVAADAFYVGDGDICKLVANKTVVQLNPLLTGDKSKSKPDDFVQTLWGGAKTKNGNIYGAPVDCNPLLLWMNKKVLQDAKITTMPYELYEKGQWTRDAFQEMLDKIHASGKYGFILSAWPLQYWSFCTTMGGTIYADNGYGDLIVHQDAKSLETMKWLTDNIRNKKITYEGALPKGQGTDLAFIGGQAGFLCAGRWFLPEFKTATDLKYDCVPLPSATGKIAPAAVALAYMAMNKKTKNQDATFEFLTNYVSAEGQTFRLSGGGNAVPSIKSADTEKVVLEGNVPEHAHYLLDARNAGYALFPSEASTPALSDDIKKGLEPVFLQGKDLTTALAAIAADANPRIKEAQAKQV